MKFFEKYLKETFLERVSFFDVTAIKGEKVPEKIYSHLLLGLTAAINKEHYIIQSNKESGEGRFDIAIIPKNHERLGGTILELKSIKEDKQDLQEAAKVAC